MLFSLTQHRFQAEDWVSGLVLSFDSALVDFSIVSPAGLRPAVGAMLFSSKLESGRHAAPKIDFRPGNTVACQRVGIIGGSVGGGWGMIQRLRDGVAWGSEDTRGPS